MTTPGEREQTHLVQPNIWAALQQLTEVLNLAWTEGVTNSKPNPKPTCTRTARKDHHILHSINHTRHITLPSLCLIWIKVQAMVHQIPALWGTMIHIVDLGNVFNTTVPRRSIVASLRNKLIQDTRHKSALFFTDLIQTMIATEVQDVNMTVVLKDTVTILIQVVDVVITRECTTCTVDTWEAEVPMTDTTVIHMLAIHRVSASDWIKFPYQADWCTFDYA